jgi:nucleoid-associated protein YgaU
LYNYGFQNYNAGTARFTTLDPIRDGDNWFVYVNGEPVGRVDLWGLSGGNLCDNNLTQVTIKPDDTLSKIVRDYNAKTGLDLTLNEVVEYNGIKDPNLIFSGDTILMPVKWWKAVERLSFLGWFVSIRRNRDYK